MVIPGRGVKSIADKEFLKVDPLDPDVAVEDVNTKVMNMLSVQLRQNGNNSFMISAGSGAK